MLQVNSCDVIVGGQYGSEGKGAVAAAYSKVRKYGVMIRVAGPNAGHTVVDPKGIPRALRAIPAAGLVDEDATLYIAPGSEIDLEVLQNDLNLYEEAGVPCRGRLFVSPQATVLTEEHRRQESAPGHGIHGSTGKGIGAARAARAMRSAPTVIELRSSFHSMGVMVDDLDHRPPVQNAMIEGTQGYWLGTHAGLYPYCTSSDCRAIDFLAMAGVNARYPRAVVVVRSYPIRIAGNSGPLSRETTWEEIGVPPEYTTVTHKMRRVGHFEPSQTEIAINANYFGITPPQVAITFADYWSADRDEQLRNMESALNAGHMRLVRYVGTGPDSGWWR